MLETARLLTIIGPGGVGKTRLAAAVAARRTVPSIFVDLTRVRVLPWGPNRSPINSGSSTPAPIRSRRRSSTHCRVRCCSLDSRARDESAAQIATLVGAAACLVVLATSREPLRVDGPVVFALEPAHRPLRGKRGGGLSELAEAAPVSPTSSSGPGLVGAAEGALERIGGRIYPDDTPAHERVAAGLIDALGPEEYGRWYAAGATLTFDQSVDLALGQKPVSARGCPNRVGDPAGLDPDRFRNAP